MEFKQVNFYQLKRNTKYIITDLNGAFYYTGWFSIYLKNGKDTVQFKDVTCNVPIKGIVVMYHFRMTLVENIIHLSLKKMKYKMQWRQEQSIKY